MIQNITVLLCIIIPLYSLLSFNLLPQMTHALLIAQIPLAEYRQYVLITVAVYLVGGLIGGLLTGLIALAVYEILFGGIQAVTLEITCGFLLGGILFFMGSCLVIAARHWDRMT